MREEVEQRVGALVAPQRTPARGGRAGRSSGTRGSRRAADPFRGSDRPPAAAWCAAVPGVSTVTEKSVILDRRSTTTCRGCMGGHRRQEPVWSSVRGAGVKAGSPRSGGGAKRRALTPVSTRARCWLDDAGGDHNILRSTGVQFRSDPRERQHWSNDAEYLGADARNRNRAGESEQQERFSRCEYAPTPDPLRSRPRRASTRGSRAGHDGSASPEGRRRHGRRLCWSARATAAGRPFVQLDRRRASAKRDSGTRAEAGPAA